MRYMMMKMILLGLMLFASKVPVLGQNTDIRCEVSGFDFNLSGDDPEYFTIFGSFLMNTSARGEKSLINKFYKLPRTKLILSVLTYASPKDGTLDDTLVLSMFLSEKRVSPSDFEDEKTTKGLVNSTQAVYPITAFDKGDLGVLSMPFLGKKKPVQIMMKCKRVKKAGK